MSCQGAWVVMIKQAPTAKRAQFLSNENMWITPKTSITYSNILLILATAFTVLYANSSKNRFDITANSFYRCSSQTMMVLYSLASVCCVK